MDNKSLSCSICTQLYMDSADICSTVCGHIFHFSCFIEWQQRNNRCPVCNQDNPQPHRIFLDLEVIQNNNTNSGTSAYKVLIKGIDERYLVEPLTSIVVDLAKIMDVLIRESDIETVYKIGNKLHIEFKSENGMNLFLKNKYKLKRNSGTAGLIVHEVLDPETQELFLYSHKLKDVGFQIIFVRNKMVFVKKNNNSRPIQIQFTEQVDRLYEQNECNIL